MNRRSGPLAGASRVAAVGLALLFAGCGTGSATGSPSPGAPGSPTSTATPVATTAGPTPTPGASASQGPTITTGVPYMPSVRCAAPDAPAASAMCQPLMDIAAPVAASSAPIFVLIRGGPDAVNGEDYMLDLATSLAGRGALAIVAAWRQSPDYGGGYPTSFEDIACGIGVARAIGPSYGGDANRVILVGHSLGGWAATIVGLTPTEYTPEPGACNQTAGSLRPEGFADFDGNIDEAVPDTFGDTAHMLEFIGADRKAQPARWAAIDAFALLAAHPPKAGTTPILIGHGDTDAIVNPAVARAFDAALTKAAVAHRLLIVPGDHGAILYASATVDALMTMASPAP